MKTIIVVADAIIPWPWQSEGHMGPHRYTGVNVRLYLYLAPSCPVLSSSVLSFSVLSSPIQSYPVPSCSLVVLRRIIARCMGVVAQLVTSRPCPSVHRSMLVPGHTYVVECLVMLLLVLYTVTECGQGPCSVYVEIMSVTTNRSYPIRCEIV